MLEHIEAAVNRLTETSREIERCVNEVERSHAHRKDSAQAFGPATTLRDRPRASKYQANRFQQVLPAAEVAQALVDLSTGANESFVPAQHSLFLGRRSILLLLLTHTGDRWVRKAPSPLISSIQFRQSRFIHGQTAPNLLDDSSCAYSTSSDLQFAEPGVEPLSTLVSDYARATSYRSYLLDDTSPCDNFSVLGRNSGSRIVSKMPQLVSRMYYFDESHPIALVSFLPLFCLAMHGLHLSEDTACSVISWFFDELAMTVYSA